MSSTSIAIADVEFPSTKYDIGDCIISISSTSSWYGKEAKVIDVVYGKFINGYVYYLQIPESSISLNGFFSIDYIDAYTSQVTQCTESLYRR